MSKKSEDDSLPSRATDLKKAIARVILSAFPGGIELYNTVIGPEISKRYGEWSESLDSKLMEAEQARDDFRIEDLVDNESFVSTVLQATQSAMRSHQEEKLEALKNAVLNSALPTAPEEDKQAIFLNLIDEFTPLHLKMLSMYKNITDDKIGGPVMSSDLEIIIDGVFPDIKNNVGLYSVIIGDLASRELVRKDYGGTFADNIGTHYAARITPMGIEFLDFISSPLEDEK
jgi:hypothetical protein